MVTLSEKLQRHHNHYPPKEIHIVTCQSSVCTETTDLFDEFSYASYCQPPPSSSMALSASYGYDYNGHCSFRPQEGINMIDYGAGDLTMLDLSRQSMRLARGEETAPGEDGRRRDDPVGEQEPSVAGFVNARASTFGKNMVTIGMMLTGQCKLQIKAAPDEADEEANKNKNKDPRIEMV